MSTLKIKDADGTDKYLTGMGAGSSGDPFVAGRLDDEYVGSNITCDVFHYAVHEGLGFSATTFATSGDLYICFTTPNSETYLHLLMDMSGEKNCALEVWEGVTPGATATEKIIYNKNRRKQQSACKTCDKEKSG